MKNDTESMFDDELTILSEIVSAYDDGEWVNNCEDDIDHIKQSIKGKEKEFLKEFWNRVVSDDGWKMEDFRSVHEAFTPNIEYSLDLNIK